MMTRSLTQILHVSGDDGRRLIRKRDSQWIEDSVELRLF